MTYPDDELDNYARNIKADIAINRGNGNYSPYAVMCGRIDDECLKKLVCLLKSEGMSVIIHEPGTPVHDEAYPQASRFMLIDRVITACN